MKKHSKHYHVLFGIHGCIPDTNEVYLTKRDAREALKELVSYLKEDGLKFSGSLQDGYFEELKSQNRLFPNNYLEITECYESSCLDD